MMFIHNFHLICKNGHKKNLTYYHGKKNKLKTISDFCIICDKRVQFNIIKYFEDVKKYGVS